MVINSSEVKNFMILVLTSASKQVQIPEYSRNSKFIEVSLNVSLNYFIFILKGNHILRTKKFLVAISLKKDEEIKCFKLII